METAIDIFLNAFPIQINLSSPNRIAEKKERRRMGLRHYRRFGATPVNGRFRDNPPPPPADFEKWP